MGDNRALRHTVLEHSQGRNGCDRGFDNCARALGSLRRLRKETEMKASDFLILGGGIAGTTAAEVLRELDSYAEISIIEAEPHPLYSRVWIPKYLEHKIKRDALFLRKIQEYAAKKIGLYLSRRVNKVDYQRREVYTDDGNVFPYKKLLIASGGAPSPWTLPGTASPEFAGRILRMHTLDDADNILAKMKSAAGKEVLVIGEGFIALEFMEIFLKNNFTVHAVSKGEYFNEKYLGESGGKIMGELFLKNEIKVHKKTEPATIHGMEVNFTNGDRVLPELVGVGTGIFRNLNPFGGIKTGTGILTNEFLETSEENTFAAGDIAEFPDAYSGATRALGNWTNAVLQGRAAASNMFASLSGDRSKQMPYQVVPTYNISILNLRLTFLGFLEDADEIWEKVYDGAVARVFLKEKKIRGAVLINRFDDKLKIAELIKANGEINELEKAFS